MTNGVPAAAAIACPVCTAGRFRPTFTAAGHRFERCRTCGFVRMADAPTSASLADFYAMDRCAGVDAAQDHATNLARFDGILAQIERHLRPGRLLDVGCSIGSSLLAAQRRGWQAVGLELSQPAAAHGRAQWQLDIRTQTLADAGFAAGSFDAVLMHHTLEHLEAPDAVLAQVRTVLAPGGVMYQSLPNHGSLKGRLLGRHFGYGVTHEHLSHFTARTLRRLVCRVGFTVLAQQTRSYRQDPRLLWDFACRLGRRRWLERKIGLQPGQQIDIPTYVAFLARTRWALWLCNMVWPARLCQWLGLGEDLHLLARR